MRAYAALALVAVVTTGCSKLLGISNPVTGDATPADDGRPDTMIDSSIDAPPPCAAPNTFGNEMMFPIGDTGVGFAVASLDPGGTLDVAIATPTKVVILHGDGTGTVFATPLDLATPAAGVAVEDFTNDGLNDVISWSGDSIVLHERTGGGLFLAPVPLPGTFLNVKNALPDDLLGVPRIDLIVQDDNARRVFEQNAGGLASTNNVIGAAGDDLLLTGDIDGIGDADVVLVDQASNVKLSRQLGVATTIATGATGRAVGFGNFDGTGLPDLVIATAAGGVIFQQTAPGTFAQIAGTIPGVVGDTLLVADVNNDGTDDIAVPGSVVLQCPAPSPSGVFTQVESVSSVAPALLVDLNANQRPDLLRLVGTNLVVRLQ